MSLDITDVLCLFRENLDLVFTCLHKLYKQLFSTLLKRELFYIRPCSTFLSNVWNCKRDLFKLNVTCRTVWFFFFFIIIFHIVNISFSLFSFLRTSKRTIKQKMSLKIPKAFFCITNTNTTHHNFTYYFSMFFFFFFCCK